MERRVTDHHGMCSSTLLNVLYQDNTSDQDIDHRLHQKYPTSTACINNNTYNKGKAACFAGHSICGMKNVCKIIVYITQVKPTKDAK
jgi:hypothetical protein